MKTNIEIETRKYYKTKSGSMVEPLQNVAWKHPTTGVCFTLLYDETNKILYTNEGIAVYDVSLEHSEQNSEVLSQLNIVGEYVFEEQEMEDYKAQLLADNRLVSLSRLR